MRHITQLVGIFPDADVFMIFGGCGVTLTRLPTTPSGSPKFLLSKMLQVLYIHIQNQDHAPHPVELGYLPRSWDVATEYLGRIADSDNGETESTQLLLKLRHREVPFPTVFLRNFAEFDFASLELDAVETIIQRRLELGLDRVPNITIDCPCDVVRLTAFVQRVCHGLTALNIGIPFVGRPHFGLRQSLDLRDFLCNLDWSLLRGLEYLDASVSYDPDQEALVMNREWYKSAYSDMDANVDDDDTAYDAPDIGPLPLTPIFQGLSLNLRRFALQLSPKGHVLLSISPFPCVSELTRAMMAIGGRTCEYNVYVHWDQDRRTTSEASDVLSLSFRREIAALLRADTALRGWSKLEKVTPEAVPSEYRLPPCDHPLTMRTVQRQPYEHTIIPISSPLHLPFANLLSASFNSLLWQIHDTVIPLNSPSSAVHVSSSATPIHLIPSPVGSPTFLFWS